MHRQIIFKIAVGLAIVAALFLAVRFLLGGDEDTWICYNNEWVRHGNPSRPPPEKGCGTDSNTLPSGHRYKQYKTEGYEINYPDWTKVADALLTSPEKTKVAVQSGECSFVVTFNRLGEDQKFKDTISAEIDSQVSKARGQVMQKKITDNTSLAESEIEIQGTKLHSYSYGVLVGKSDIYFSAFISESSAFEKSCRPFIEETINSIKTK